MHLKTLFLASAAVLVAVPFNSHVVLAQGNNTYVAPGEGQSGDEQTPPELKKQHRQGQTNDEQSSREMKKRHMEGQSGDEEASRDVKRQGKLAYDRDRHGERMRHREGRFRYFHEGYYYASPWWTVGVAVEGGIGCREGARIVFQRGFNRVVPIDCGGDVYTYRGWRGGEPWRVRIDSDTGRIVAVRPAG